ncbi:MAG TPA: lysophospholipid acyltransferase family protein, partial [Chitinophagales bacterium]|nr:lysophospholipid acyltransferase family protein [Chitinophagales bacterium]
KYALMRTLLGVIRLIVFLACTLFTIAWFAIGGWFVKDTIERRFKARKFFIAWILKVLNVHIKFYGIKPNPKFNGFVIANHRSYFDPVAILHDIDALSVAKAEVSNWPIISTGAKMVGAIWVNRQEKDSRKAARDKMLEMVKLGYSIMIFPEGTSHTGAQMLELRNATFEMAVENGFPVLPVAIEYEHGSDAFVGNDTFIPHFLKCFGKWRTNVGVYFSEPISGTNAIAVKEQAVATINRHIAELREDLHYKEP